MLISALSLDRPKSYSLSLWLLNVSVFLSVHVIINKHIELDYCSLIFCLSSPLSTE